MTEKHTSGRAGAAKGHAEDGAHDVAHSAAPGHTGHESHDRHAGHGAAPARAGHEGQAAHAEPGAAPGHAHDGHREHGSPVGHGGGSAHAEHAGHDKHAGHSVEMFRSKFWVSLLLTLPTLVFGHMIADLLGRHPVAFPGSQWIAPIFGTAVFVYGGRVFLEGALGELRARVPGMMTLIALAITVAFLFSVAVTLGFPGMPLWEELATLVTIMLLGHWLEMRSIQQASGALNELAKLLPAVATRLVDGREEEVSVDSLAAGDLVLVRPGASVPADGLVREGRSAVNEAMITGESRPLDKGVGDAVIGGTVNGNGSLRVEITKTGEASALAGIMRLVAQAQGSRSRAQALADRAARLLTVVALGAGAVTLAAWVLIRGDWSFAIERTVTTLVIACPHALGLAIPLVIAISTTLGARHGLLVRDRRGLEEARHLDAVIFDKTGTLTLGEQRVVEVVTSPELAADEALRLAAALEQDSEHPVARAIVASAAERRLSVPQAADFRSVPGQGVAATVDGRALQGGGPNLLRALGATPAGELEAAAARFAAAGQAAIYLVEDGRVRAVFAIADQVRAESREAVARLQARGIEVVMLTGDAEAVAQHVARELGIAAVFAEVLPEQKAELVKQLQRQGKRVAMVGDGVNDAPALLTADVGIAIGAGTDVAVEAGDVVLVRSDPRDVARIVELSRASYRKMIQNLWWAAGYNVFAIPLAAGVLVGRGIVLDPALGAVLMSMSTIVVALNAQLLRRIRL